MTIYLSLLCALVGLLMYALSSNPKLQEIGRLSFACGLLAFLIRVSDAAFQIIK
jgi:Na+/phosphate symporter